MRVISWESVVPRKQLDISRGDILRGIKDAVSPSLPQRDDVEEQICTLWSGHDGLVSLSVRTAFDLYLQALALPPGCEVLMSAITIKDMVTIVEHHGLCPVPVDIDTDTLAVDIECLRRAISKNTRLVVVAHLFGSRAPLDEVVALARQHNLMVVEDAAEAFVGHSYKGHDDVDISLFSFGTIKTATALGGCVARVKNSVTRARMTALQAGYPVRPRRVYASRLAKYLVANSLTTPAVFGPVTSALSALGADVDSTITSISRGFPGPELLALIRQRASVPLLLMLRRVLETFTPSGVYARRSAARELAQMLSGHPGIHIPGLKNECHSFWLFPIMVAQPKQVCDMMRAQNFDVTTGTTQLGSIDAYVSDQSGPFKRGSTRRAAAMMQSVVYLPVIPGLAKGYLSRMASAVQAAARHVSKL